MYDGPECLFVQNAHDPSAGTDFSKLDLVWWGSWARQLRRGSNPDPRKMKLTAWICCLGQEGFPGLLPKFSEMTSHVACLKRFD
jgi:hypothetical protein